MNAAQAPTPFRNPPSNCTSRNCASVRFTGLSCVRSTVLRATLASGGEYGGAGCDCGCDDGWVLRGDAGPERCDAGAPRSGVRGWRCGDASSATTTTELRLPFGFGVLDCGVSAAVAESGLARQQNSAPSMQMS